MFSTLLPENNNLSTSANIPFTGYNPSFDINQAIFPQTEANSFLMGGVQPHASQTDFPLQIPDTLPATSRASLADPSLDPLTGEAMSEVYKALMAFAKDPNFTAKMNVPFGESWDAEKANTLKEQWLRGDFSNIPLLKIVSSGDIAAAHGAFAATTNTIYVSREFLGQNTTRLDVLTGVLLEEVGHFIDSQVNQLDSPGDEGEIFAAIVQGKELSPEKLQVLKAEDDRAIAMIEGKEISIEQAANTVTVTATDASAAETSSGETPNPGMYRISQTGITTSALTVSYTMSGTASNGSDYTTLSGTATIPAGQTYVDVPLNITDDTLVENNETAILTVSAATNYTVGATNTATVTIADNDQNTVTVSVTDASAAETASGETPNPGMYRISRTGSTTSALTVPYTMDGTATNGSDYTSLNGTATIPAGQTYVDVPLNVIDDTLVENNETAILTVSPSTNYILGAVNSGIIAIADNDQNTVTVSATDASAAETASGETPNPGMYRISRTGSTTSALTVPYTMDGTATNGSDYTSLNGTATIPAGQTFVDVPLTVIDDTLIENNETAILTVSAATNYTVGATNTATVTIADNDQNTVTVSATDASAAETASGESPNPGMYRISRTGSTSAALTVPYTMSGTGTNGSDYTSLNGTATIAAGQTFVDVPLTVIDDTLIENNETAILTVSTSANYTVGATNTATVTIADNDQNTVTVSATDASAAETASGETPNPGMYRISRTGSTSAALSVPYTMSGTGTNGSDYSSLNGTATIAAGQTFVDVPLTVIDDTLIENNETAILTVSTSSNYTVGATNTATVTIADNDQNTVTVSATDASAAETASGETPNPGMYRISRTGSTNGALTVPYTMSGTGTNGSDYSSLNGTATIAAGQTFVDVPLTVIDDTLIENNETAILTVSTSSNYTVGATNTATVTIADNDQNTVTVSVTDPSAAETASGETPNPGMYRISRTGSTSAALTVPYTMAGTASNGSDYSLTGSATIPAGQTFVDVPLNVIDDTLVENNETAILTVSPSTNYTLGATNIGMITIADNDRNTVTVSATDASAAETASGQTPNPGMYRISRTGSTSSALSVPYTMSGTASNGTDYTSLSGTATIPAGETFVDVPLKVIDDTLIENNETAILTVSASTNYTVGATNTATVTIADNDVAIPDYAGNTPSAARQVTVGSSSSTWTDWVGTEDTNDYYRFTLDNNSNFNLTLNGLSSDADVTLLDSTGTNVLQGSYSGNTTAESISTVLNPGAYYVRVFPYSGSTNYNLTMSAVPNLSTVTVSATDASAAETASGQTPNPGMYRISRTGSTSTALTVPYKMTGTAINGTDYSSLSGTATIPAGQTFVDVPLNVIDDTLVESNETAILTVSASTNYTVGATNAATVTIADNDVTIPDYAGNTPSAARQVTVGSSSSTWTDWVGTEDTNDYYRFTLNNSSNFNLSLNGLSSDADVYLLDSTGTNVLQSSTFGGSTAESISTVLNPGAYYVRVFPYSGSTNYNLTMSAVPNLSTVTVSATDASAAETASGQTPNPGMYRISRTGSTSTALTVPYTMSGTATNGSDYTSLNGTATIPAGLTFVDVPLTVIDDTLVESNETAILTVSASSNYTVGATNTATVTIADNDQNTVTVSATDASAAETASGQTPNPGMYRITRTGSTTSALSVPYTMSGTATNGSDYTSLSGTATIPAGLTFVDVPLNVIDDTLVESNETAILTVSASSNYTVGATNTATVTIADNDLADWFEQNIQDLGLRTTARTLASDGVINRNDMISILRNAEDSSVIDSAELADLRKLLTSNTRPFIIPDFVQNLTYKLVNGDLANQSYQGSYLGNLSANSSATQMENLISKWFLGNDRPSTPYTYQYASGSLFQNGVSYQDIDQGGLGDCYFLASLAATAFRSPSTILNNMFIDNGDNTYTVRFYKNGAADYVTVDRYLPTYSFGGLPYAQTPNSELWVAFAEKAYAQVNQSGWLEQQNGTNTYSGINGGLGYYAMRYVTGRNTAYIYDPSGIVDTNAIMTAFNAGQMITIGSKVDGVASNVVPQHEYVLVGYNSSTQKFSLYNPHGVNSTPNSGHLDLTASQLSQSFDYWAYTTENGLPQYGSSGTLPPALFS